MAANSKFAIAIHTLGVLAFTDERPIPSDLIAQSVKTNPVVIRRIIKRFEECGLVNVQMGAGGGSRLSKSPEDISLAEIYQALDDEKLFEVPELDDSHGCPIGRVVRPVLSGLFGNIERLVANHLGGISLRDVMDSVGKQMNCSTQKGE